MKTAKDPPHGALYYLLFILALVLPWLAVLLLPPRALPVLLSIWLTLLFGLLLVRLWLAARLAALSPPLPDHPQGPRMLADAELPPAVREVMDVRVALEEAGVRIFRGPLLEPASAAYAKLKRAFGREALPLLQHDYQLGSHIVLLPAAAADQPRRPPTRLWFHWLLFALTLLTTTWAGALHQGINLLQQPWRFTVGLPYSLALLAVLGIHELGHYFTARRHGMDVTPPYFIPVPFALGTFGAFIKMRSAPEDRRALFDVAIAGPLAGLLVAIAALWAGLHFSNVAAPTAPLPALAEATSVHSSLLFGLLAKLHFGNTIDFDAMISLSPLAFAGWLGLFVTALNLLPVGQLDGGHIARGMFGLRAGQAISTLAMWSLFLLAVFVWPGLMVWALIVFFLAGRGTPPLNDITPLSPTRRALGYLAFAILLSILVPMPRPLWDAAALLLA